MQSSLSQLYNTECFHGHMTGKVIPQKQGKILSLYGSTPCVLTVLKSILRTWYTVWINYMKDEGKKLWYGKSDWIAPPSKQLISDWLLLAKVPVQIIFGYGYQYDRKQTSKQYSTMNMTMTFSWVHSTRYHCCYSKYKYVTKRVIWFIHICVNYSVSNKSDTTIYLLIVVTVYRLLAVSYL